MPPDYAKKKCGQGGPVVQHSFVPGEICMLVDMRPRSQETEMDLNNLDLETPGPVLVDFDWTGKDGETNHLPMCETQL